MLEHTTQPKTLIEKLEHEHDDRELTCQDLFEDGHFDDKKTELLIQQTGVMAGLQIAIDIVKQHSEWVPVDERLPSDGDIVEVYRNSYKWGDLVWQCLYTDKHSFRNYPAGTVGKNDKITHWRPIQPPSEVQP